MTGPLRVVHTDPSAMPDFELEHRLLAAAGLELVLPTDSSPDSILAVARDAIAAILYNAPVDRQVIEGLPAVGLLSCSAVGTDNIDNAAAAENGVWISNTPGENTTEVATHALGMTLSLIRHLPFYDREVRSGIWNEVGPGILRRPGSLTLGIAGLGAIGRTLANYAEPIFGSIHGYDPYASEWPEHVERHDSIGSLLAVSDAVSLHLPLTPQTEGLINAETIAAMRPGSYVVNAARGSIVDIDALLEALNSGHLGGAALDVLPQEPPPTDHPLLSHPRVMLSPHAGYYSREANEGVRATAVQNIISWVETGRPIHTVLEGTRSANRR